MFKGCLVVLAFGGLFILLIVCFPFHYQQETSPVAPVEVVATEEIESHIATVCENTVLSYMGEFDYSQQAIDRCKEILLQHYNSLGTWPGPQMVTSNCSAAFLAAKDVSESWAFLDFSSAKVVYRAEDAREILMQYMKEQRLAMGL